MQSSPSTGLRRYLPEIGTPAYHLMLAVVAICILGPLGGISAAFMNFSIGFFVGGQVLAGILGSAVTLPYGPEGKHGANYMHLDVKSQNYLVGRGGKVRDETLEIRSLNNARAARGRKGKAADLGFKPNRVTRVE